MNAPHPITALRTEPSVHCKPTWAMPGCMFASFRFYRSRADTPTATMGPSFGPLVPRLDAAAATDAAPLRTHRSLAFCP
jgi:hypothetical protein